jgi:sugar lactone lactonase YvrE
MPNSFTQLRGFACLALLVIAAAPGSRAAHTRTWVQTDYEDFEKGVLKNLSLRSDGRLTLAPRSEERFDSTSAYLWALAQDSKGNLYTGGGPGAKLYRVSPKGEKKTLAEFEALEIHAIAVDSKDRVFAATSPDGKIYRVAADGKSEVFYDPKCKYIWAMVFSPQGDLFVATGDHGEVHRVSPDGKGKVFFKSDETHVRSLTLDGKGNLIAGTEPGGLVLRISPTGEGFVLYDMAKREITSVAVAKDGSIYAAGVGSPSAAPSVPAPPPTPAPAPAAPAMNPNQPRVTAAAPPPSLAVSGTAPIAGGSDVYRIHPDGHPQKVFSAAQEIVYAIGFETEGRALIGTGNKGYIYRLDSDGLYTAWLNVGPTQVTAFAPGRDGKIYAATGNVGKVYEVGPGPAAEGSIESDVFDAGLFSLWGRVSFKGTLHGGRIAIRTRSGNLDHPEKNWSEWSDAISSSDGARTTSPASRFFQWKATLSSAGGSPQLDAIEVAYLARNVAPRLEEIEVTPANYRFPAPSLPSGPSQTLSLPPLGKRARTASSVSLDTGTPSMQFAKGAIGARWNAIDENGDAMIYSVHIRGMKESEWKLLKEKVRERHLSWDSTAFPDGEYQIRVTASDLPGNTKEDALEASLESDPFLIDNTPPRISGLTAAPAGRKLAIRWKAVDALSVISKAEYSLDGGEWTLVTPVGKLSDSLSLDYDLTLDDVVPGEHTIAVRVEDEYANQATDKVVVK